MYKKCLLAACVLAASVQAAAQFKMEREAGALDLTFASKPTRSMAQGLVQPATRPGMLGGVDIRHPAGWYIGSWTANVTTERPMEVDSYAGYMHQLGGGRLGYELGAIHYGHPQRGELDTQAVYGGLSIFGSRLGAAYSNQPGRHSTTFFAGLKTKPLLGANITFKYSIYSLDTPVGLSNGGSLDSFDDWSINLSRSWKGLDLNFSYSDSSLGAGDCDAYSGHNSYCGSAFMLKASQPLY